MSDIVERARGLLGGVNAERGQWEAHCYHAFAFIGNADFAAAAPQLVAELADKLSEVRQIIADDDARGAMPGFMTVDKIREALESDRG